MKSAIVVFPASNCDRDAATALESLTGTKPHMVWHGDAELPDVDLIVLPGGFSYGDYLRSGAMSAHSRIMGDVKDKAEKGVLVLGICNGFQVLTEAGFLPGVLMRNVGLNFVCRPVKLVVEESQSAFTCDYSKGDIVSFPVAHGDGNYFADDETLERLEGEGRVAFRYAPKDNPNGSCNGIAGILNEKRNVLGLMPHPERACELMLGGTGRTGDTGSTDGRALFQSLIDTLS